MNIYIYSDESGVFDYSHDKYFVFGGVICFGNGERERWARMYSNVEKTLRETKQCEDTYELKASKKAGVKHFLCVSAQGANTESPFFYNRLKGMLEEGLTMMNFDALTLVRPSLLLGKHKDRRFGEELMQKIFGKHPEWIPERLRPVYAENVAAHLAASFLKPPTQHVCATDGVKGKRIIYNRVLAQTKVEELF